MSFDWGGNKKKDKSEKPKGVDLEFSSFGQ